MYDLDQRDRELLSVLQSEIPLASTPYALIGQQLDMSEKEVLKRTSRLKLDGTIRHLGASFDGKALGYTSCLVAARVSPDRIADAADVVNAHPCVSQNYSRNHEFNLWFTIAVPAHSQLGLQRTVDILAAEAGCEAVRLLPTVRLFKAAAEGESQEDKSSVTAHPLSSEETEHVRLLQNDLPLQPRPFDSLARLTGTDAGELLATARRLYEAGVMRKLSATVQPKKATFSTTAMGVWVVPEDQIDDFGRRMADYRAVSHCFLRPTYSDWPYNMFTTVHGRSVDECESVLSMISTDTAISEMAVLFPTHEYRRARIRYLSPELESWESARVEGAAQTA